MAMPPGVSLGAGQRSSGDGGELVAAIAKIREAERDEDGNELSSTVILELLKQDGAFPTPAQRGAVFREECEARHRRRVSGAPVSGTTSYYTAYRRAQ